MGLRAVVVKVAQPEINRTMKGVKIELDFMELPAIDPIRSRQFP